MCLPSCSISNWRYAQVLCLSLTNCRVPCRCSTPRSNDTKVNGYDVSYKLICFATTERQILIPGRVDGGMWVRIFFVQTQSVNDAVPNSGNFLSVSLWSTFASNLNPSASKEAAITGYSSCRPAMLSHIIAIILSSNTRTSALTLLVLMNSFPLPTQTFRSVLYFCGTKYLLIMPLCASSQQNQQFHRISVWFQVLEAARSQS